MTGRIAAEVFPPGEFIRDELDARGWTQNDLAEILGRPFRLVNELVAGKRGITPETAKGLGEAFGTDPQFWLNLDSAYQLSRVKGSGGDVARKARLYEAAPIKDMIRRYWIPEAAKVDELERSVLEFFGVGSIDEIPSACLDAAARKSTSYAKTTPEQRAWFCRVRQLASTLPSGRFRESGLDDLLTALQQLTVSEQEARHVPRLLADYGIRFLIVEHLPKTRIDGVALWLDRQSPVVALSVRLDRIDSFWFTLLHELGHISRGDSREGSAVQAVDEGIAEAGSGSPEELPESERLANEFAREHLVPRQEIESFIARVRPLYSRARINQFANRIQVHPGIIIGQLQWRGEIKFSQGREMLAKVRDVVTQSATTDGWGHFSPVL